MAVLALMTSWFTPTTLFLVLNLMIGTIVITSRFGSGSKKQPRDGFGSDHHLAPLARAPSLIDRVKSINLNLYKFPASSNSETEFFQIQQGDPGSVHNPAPLVRAPSLLDRVKSINLSYFKFPHYNPDIDYAQASQPDYSNTVDPTRLDRVDATSFSQFEFSDHIPENDYPRQNEPDYPETSDLPRLARAPLLERVKSINFSSFYRSEQPNPETHFDQITKTDKHNTHPNPVKGQGRITESKPRRSTSERSKTAAKASEKMTKSRSEKDGMAYAGEERRREEETVEALERRRPATTRVERSTSFGDGEQSVDAKAADFINKFKQQLKLQRLDSILRNKEMTKA